MAENSAQEKTEQPTEKRREDSRKKGEVARSRELNTLISLVSALLGLVVLGGDLAVHLAGQLGSGLSHSALALKDPANVLLIAADATRSAIWALVPLFALMLCSVFVGPMLMGGFIFRFEALAPKLEKLDPIKGLGRIFSVNGLMELFKALGKFLLIGFAGWLFITTYLSEVMVLGLEPIARALNHSLFLIILCLLATSSVLVLVAAMDVPFQIFQHTKKLKMTKQEIKDEQKETDGRPEVKSRIRSLQQEVAQRRMMEDVKTADVVIRNPTHFAVALKYGEEMLAPKVVALGQDLIALEIINVAEQHGVAVFSAPPLARALYASSEIGYEIPAHLYVGVAKVLAYVFQLKQADSSIFIEPPSPEDLLPEEDLS